MAARRSWCVFIDDNRQIHGDDEVQGKYNANTTEILSVFFRESQAEAYARAMALRHPGKDIHVFKQMYGFSSQPTTPQHKIWDDNGQFIPAT